MAPRAAQPPAWARRLPLAQQLTLRRILTMIPEAEVTQLLRVAASVLPRQRQRGPRSRITDAMLLDIATDLLTHPSWTIQQAAAHTAQQILAEEQQRPKPQRLQLSPGYLRRTLREAARQLPIGIWLDAERRAKVAGLLPTDFSLFARLETVLGISLPDLRSWSLSPLPALSLSLPARMALWRASAAVRSMVEQLRPIAEVGERLARPGGVPVAQLLELAKVFPALHDWPVRDLVQLYLAIADVVANMKPSCED